ncbi:MAG: rane protein [Clostridiaceae bacterium]|jgi:inner membrane protein|nr:rane protein [Clostridiaceae bacterium]
MKGKTHAGIGMITYIAVCNQLPGKFNYLGAAIAIISSLLPDIDHPKSILNRYILPFKNKMAKIVLYACSGIIILWYDYIYVHQPILKAIAIMFFVIALSSHRKGLTHSITGMIMFGLIVGFIGNMYNRQFLIYSFIAGYGMHLICDMATDRGIPLFYPFKTKNVKWPMTYKTSSKMGNFIEELIMIIGLLYIVMKLPKMF